MALAMHAQLLAVFRAKTIDLTKSEHEIIDPLDDMKNEPAIAEYITHVRTLFVLLRTEAHFRMEIILSALHDNKEHMSRHIASYDLINQIIDVRLSRCRESMCKIRNPIF